MSSEDIAHPKTNFQSQAAEGDIMAKQGEYRKAIESYTRALGFRPTDKNVLLARSKMYLALGDAPAALEDAEAALKEDPDFFKAKYLKAESLYAMGDFENALVFYHRGHKARPEMDEFRLGIQKAREAIDNSIGKKIDSKDYRMQVEKLERLNSANQHHSSQQQQQQQEKPVRKTHDPYERVNNKVPAGTAKILLGDMYTDMEYLENLLNDKEFQTNPNDTIRMLAVQGLNYLDSRVDFWRQQRPIYTTRRNSGGSETNVAAS